MLAKSRTEVSTEKLVEILKEWQRLEDESIKHAEQTLNKTSNKILIMTMEMIRNDSKKHKAMQQMLIDSLTKEALTLAPEELAGLSDALDKHIDAEAKTIELANQALSKSELFLTRYILSYLIADENKHHALLSKLDELKKATVFVT